MDFGKIKNLRGSLYRKVTEASEQNKLLHEALPGFVLNIPKKIVEFPEVTDITKVNVIYPLIEPFAYANIKWDTQAKEVVYEAIEPKLSDDEKNLLQRISDGLVELVDVPLSAIKENVKAMDYLQKNVDKVLREYGIFMDKAQYAKMMYYVYRNFLGFNKIEAFLQDPNIEDISCDGVGTPMYVVHQKFGSLKTNIGFEEMEELREFIVKLAERTGRYVSYAEPILAGTLPDGSRISATLAGDVATRGPTFTIRKFSENPFSPAEQIELGTVNPELLAYFWYLVENGISMLIVGGVATGKTSLLNTMTMFIPPEDKIVSIEDTRELRIPNEHWVPTLARVGFGIPMPSGEKYGAVSLFDLLKESFRQNPDYVIVGEVRGKEAYVMFQGMSSGHPSISTFHAGAVDQVIKRLTTPPIELSPTLMESLDLIVLMIHAKEKGKSARRVKQVVEIESVDPKTNEIKMRTVFRWNPEKDTYEKVEDSIKIPKIVAAKGGVMEDATREIEARKKILEWFTQRQIKDYKEVTKLINLYYKEPKKLMEMMGETWIETKTWVKPTVSIKTPVTTIVAEKKTEIPVAVGQKRERKDSLLSLLGFKLIREK
ncbi:MAG: type II/IV secretion system ATPase subunit [Candidatus Aenigmarchaeota archaeon]|nr:type II/IV secretion system ATPase subunit [Candidatus Aenigmarchaeota archaeon]